MKKLLIFVYVACLSLITPAQVTIQSFDNAVGPFFLDSSVLGSFYTNGSQAYQNLNNSAEHCEGTGSMKMDYKIQAAESWGGYVVRTTYTLESINDLLYIDLSKGDYLSLWYKVITPCEMTQDGRVFTEFKLAEFNTEGQIDLWFHETAIDYFDQSGQWGNITMPLVQIDDGINGFKLQYGAGDSFLQLDKIKGFEISVVYSTEGGNLPNPVASGSILIDNLELIGKDYSPITTFLSSLEFGDVIISDNKQKMFSIYNIGHANLIIDSIVSSNELFKVSQYERFELKSNDNSAILITFQPIGAVNYNGSLSIYHNAFNSPFKMNLNGTGYPSTINIDKTFSFGNGDVSNINNYRIVGLPGNSSIPIVLQGDYEYDWEVYWDNGDSADYLVKNSNYNFSPGKAYWIIGKNPLNINQQINSVALSSADYTYSIPLHPGWNLISTPFDRSTQWNSVRALNELNTNEILYAWDGNSYVNSGVMVPYEGYYFNNNRGLTQLKIPYDPNGTLGKIVSNELPVNPEDFLRVKIKDKIQTGESEIFIGINKASKDGFDENDYYAAPGDFQKSGLSLVRKELPKRDRYLFIEQRPEIGEGQEYDLEIKAIPGHSLILEFEGIENFDKYNIYLLDERLQNFYNIMEIGKIELKLAQQYNPFKLFIGTDEYIDKIKQTIQPISYELFQNYPNPFNPSTMIRFSILETERVSLKVFNVLGEVVTTLLDNEMYDTGNYEIQLNGTGLSSGVYIVGMETAKYKAQKKIILLK